MSTLLLMGTWHQSIHTGARQLRGGRQLSRHRGAGVRTAAEYGGELLKGSILPNGACAALAAASTERPPALMHQPGCLCLMHKTPLKVQPLATRSVPLKDEITRSEVMLDKAYYTAEPGVISFLQGLVSHVMGAKTGRLEQGEEEEVASPLAPHAGVATERVSLAGGAA